MVYLNSKQLSGVSCSQNSILCFLLLLLMTKTPWTDDPFNTLIADFYVYSPNRKFKYLSVYSFIVFLDLAYTLNEFSFLHFIAFTS
jgi:hypothetical protein